jgi:DNA-binding winged helix-turn-helix (wHTH) protein
MIVYQYEEAQFDPQKNAFIIKDYVSKLSASECAVFLYLIRHGGEIVKRETLLEIGWPDKVVVPNSLNVAIANIRKALRHKADLIITIKGCGFTLPLGLFEPIELTSEPFPTIDMIPEFLIEKKEKNIKKEDVVKKNLKYPLHKKLIWVLGSVSLILWITLWISNWQNPVCLNVVGQNVCGNIEQLNLNKLPSMGNYTLFIDKKGKMYEKN